MPNQGGGPNLLVANVFGVPNSVDPSTYYTPPGIAAQAISTADWYHFDGVYSGWRPYDLNSMGTDGTTIAAANARYYWPISPDHPTGSGGNWFGGMDFCHGFSSDPVIPPDFVTQSMPLSSTSATAIPPNGAYNPVTGYGNFTLYQVGQLVYCPEDTGNVFHLYCEGNDLTGTSPGLSYACTTVNGSPVLSGIASTQYLTYAGTVSGTGIPGGTSGTPIIAIGAIATGSTLGTSTTVVITAVTGTIAIGAAVVSNEFNHGGVPAGTTVVSGPGGGGIGTYVFSHACTLTGTANNLVIDDGTQVVMSANATANGTPTLTFRTTETIHECGVFRSNDLVNWTSYGPTHLNYEGAYWSSFQRVFRLGANSYTSLGFQYAPDDRNAGPPGDPVFGSALWSCSDAGLTFNRPRPPNTVVARFVGTTRLMQFAGASCGWDPVTISSQIWVPCVEDSRNVLISSANPAVVTKTAHGLVAGDTVLFNTTGVIATGDQTLGSAVITNISVNTSVLFAGCGVHPTGFFYTSAGPKTIVGIPAGTTILSVDSATQITLNIPGGGGVTQTQIGNNFQFFTLPAPILSDVNYFVLASGLTADTFEISTTSGGAAINTAGSIQTGGGALGALGHVVPNGGMWVVRTPVDSGYNVLSSPTTVRVSTLYDGVYPGPTYLQQLSSYLEDGIMYYYVERGFYNSATNFGFFDGATYLSGKGGLQEGLYDFYREIVDATAAASAAPMGVTATCSSSTVTISCYDALPVAVTGYNVYRGTSSTSFPHTVGTITASGAGGTARVQITDASAPDQAIAWYKVVTLSGTEKQARIVSCYVSSSAVNVNNHMKRVLNAGADPTTINRSFIDAVDTWLTANGMWNSLERFVDPRFGVVQAAGVVSKVFDYGTTRLPRGRDFALVTGSAGSQTASTSTYSSTGLGGTTPAWTNPNANSFGIFGGALDANGKPGALNPIRRKYEITTFAYYSKASSAGDITLIAMGDSSQTGNLALQHTSGAPGTVSFTITDYDTITNYTATKACSGTVTDARVIAGTFGGTGNLIAYDNGTPGSSVTGLHVNSDMSLPTMLKGQTGGGILSGVFLNSGSLNSKFNYF
jgi:hypothetical protein